MSGTYLTDLRDVLVAAGCNVGEIDGWESRARGSGGYHAGVWVVMWHHTASAGDGYEDALYCAHYSDVAPVCNVTIGQDGKVWLVAAGCSNTNGSGGPMTLPDGRTIPVDDCNRYAFGVEISNNGVGMAYPAAQVDAAFRVSNAVARAYIGGAYTNAAQHHDYAPGRKIDPATANAVQGSWKPASTNSSGSWNLGDLRAECAARAGGQPPPIHLPGDDEPVDYLELMGNSTQYSLFARSGVFAVNITNAERDADKRTRDPIPPTVRTSDPAVLRSLILVGEEPVWYDGSKWPPVSAFGGHLS